MVHSFRSKTVSPVHPVFSQSINPFWRVPSKMLLHCASLWPILRPPHRPKYLKHPSYARKTQNLIFLPAPWFLLSLMILFTNDFIFVTWDKDSDFLVQHWHTDEILTYGFLNPRVQALFSRVEVHGLKGGRGTFFSRGRRIFFLTTQRTLQRLITVRSASKTQKGQEKKPALPHKMAHKLI